MADFDRLLAEAKKRNIRILLDMVMNHTSDKHKWFEESSSGKTNPKRDWYIWRDGIGPNKDQPPNNWESVFGHSAWEWDAKTKQFYYHKFYIQQPDLNWRNPKVEKAMLDMVKFWLDKGVAGFRFDAIPTLFEDPNLANEGVVKDASGNPKHNAYGDVVLDESKTNNLPEVHDVLRKLRALADSYPGDRVLVGETYLPNAEELYKMYGGDKMDELQLPMDTQVGFINKLDPALFRSKIEDGETKIGTAQPLFVFDNHDNPRLDRYCTAEAGGSAADCLQIQKMLMTILFTTKSTALMYYGDEIAMKTTPPTRKEDVKDPIGVTGWPQEKGRDGDRTPMQWSPGKDAGFSTAEKTWLPIPPEYKTFNVQVEKGEPDSMLHWYEKLIELRRTNPALHDGSYATLASDNANVLTYVRKGATGKGDVVIAVNFTAQPQKVSVDVAGAGVKGTKISTLAANDAGLMKTSDLKAMTLPAYGALVVEVR
jgi:alpha-glucosidase